MDPNFDRAVAGQRETQPTGQKFRDAFSLFDLKSTGLADTETMLALLRFITVLAALASLGLAAGPIATVSSSQSFNLSGHAVTAAGITSWPLVAGDALATAKSPATLYFHDGSSVTLAAESSAKLGGSAREPKLMLTSGRFDCKLVPGSTIVITNAANPSTKGPLAGTRMDVPLRLRMPPVSAFQ
jgi:hypothetical protein